MANSHAASGDLIDILAMSDGSEATDSLTLVRANQIEVFRLILPAGKVLQEHAAAGSITIQCLTGVVELDAPDQFPLGTRSSKTSARRLPPVDVAPEPPMTPIRSAGR